MSTPQTTILPTNLDKQIASGNMSIKPPTAFDVYQMRLYKIDKNKDEKQEKKKKFALEEMMKLEIEKMRNDGMAISFWIGTNQSDVEIKCKDSNRNFCWRFIKQNNPDPDLKDKKESCGPKTLTIVHKSYHSMALRAKKGESLIPMFTYFRELQNVFHAPIETILIEEDIFDSTRKSEWARSNLAGVQCRNVRIKAVSANSNGRQSSLIVKLLNQLDIQESLIIQFPLGYDPVRKLQKLTEIPHLSMKMPSSYDNIIKNAGHNSTFFLEKCDTSFLNQLVKLLMCGQLSSIGTLELKIKSMEMNDKENLFSNLKHVDSKGNPSGRWPEMSMIEQMVILSTDGVNLRRADGALMTVLLEQSALDKSTAYTFTIYFQYPWNDPLEQKIPVILNVQWRLYQKYEILTDNVSQIISGEKKLHEWLESVEDGRTKTERELLTKRNYLALKRAYYADAITKAKIELDKYDYGRRIKNASAIVSLVCNAQKRKLFGFLTLGPNQN